jgi:hypothetical protein
MINLTNTAACEDDGEGSDHTNNIGETQVAVLK